MGKTRFLGTMPAPFIADFDHNLESVRGTPGLRYKTYDGTNFGDFLKELELWRINGPQYGCKSFCVDSLSTMSEAALEFVVSKGGNRTAQPTQPQWGEAIRIITDVLRYLGIKLDCHTVLTAHLQVEKDEMLGSLNWLPSVFGSKLPGRVPIYFSEVYYLTVDFKKNPGKPNYVVQVVPDPRVRFIKSGLNKTGVFDQYEAPDFNHLITKASKGK